MTQSIIDKASSPRALLNYYGFNSGFWPVDGSGRLHLLGDGPRVGAQHMLQQIRDASSAFGISYPSFEQDVIWAEVMRCSVQTSPGNFAVQFIYREMTEMEAASFDPSSDGFDAKVLNPQDALDYILSFDEWRRYTDDEIVDNNDISAYGGYYAPDDSWHGAGSIFGTSGLSNIGAGSSHYWNPYQGSVFFTSLGVDGEYLAWRPFRVWLTFDDESVEELPPRWASKPTGVARSATDPPWDLEEIVDLFEELDDTGWTFYDSRMVAEDVDFYTTEPVFVWVGGRVAQLRVRHDVQDPAVLYNGTLGGYPQLSLSTGTAQVNKRYENGSESSEGTVPIRIANLETRSGFVHISTFYDNPALSRLIPLYPESAGWDMHGIVTNSVAMSSMHEVEYPFFSRISSRSGLIPTITEGFSCAFALYEPWALRIGWGHCKKVYKEDAEDKGPAHDLQAVYEDALPLRTPGSSEAIAAAYEAEACGLPEAPDEDWEPLRASNSEESTQLGWVNLEPQAFRFTALDSDDSDFHDPRANLATSTVEAFLALGDGLCYEGDLGSIPRPRSGATATLLGRSITGSGDHAIEVVPIPGGHMAVMVTETTVEAWTRVDGVTTLVWSDTHAASIPPPVLAMLGADPLPALDLRFTLPDWPTPAGVLTVGGWSLILTPRGSEHRGYRWQVDDRWVSPPFTLHLGWPASQRFPNPNPRSPASYIDSGDGGGGGDPG